MHASDPMRLTHSLCWLGTIGRWEVKLHCIERRSTTEYGEDLVTWCNVSKVCNMLAKNNTDSEYYVRHLVTWCNIGNVCNMSGKNNSDSEYYGINFVTQNKK